MVLELGFWASIVIKYFHLRKINITNELRDSILATVRHNFRQSQL